jgi:putative DNA primase/helicase
VSANKRRPATIAEIEAALSTIPAQDREVWVQVGMAIKAELGDAGFPIWDYWSQTADNYRERDARDVWKSFKQGGVSLGTLFYYARLHGWAEDRNPAQSAPERPRSSTKVYALELWLRLVRSDNAVAAHQYAIAKGIESAGGAGRTTASGRIIGQEADCIVVPIWDIQTDKVQGVQCINSEGKKQTFGNISGGGLILGNILDKHIPWYVAEGWASAYSMVFHHHHGNAVCAAAFGKSNLDRLAQAIADKYAPDEITILEEVDA